MTRAFSPLHRVRSALRFAVAGIAIILALQLVAPTPAHAVSISGSGSPGSATIPYTYGDYDPWGSTITVPWRTVYESYAYRNYMQYVCVKPRLWVIGGTSWNLRDQATNCAWINAASASTSVNGVNFRNLAPYSGYSVDVVVTWHLSNGTQIGRRTYDYNSTADYQCYDAYPKCVRATTNWGGGAFIQFDW